MNTATTGIRDNRALLSTIGHRLVRSVASERSPYADALFIVLSERQRGWELGEWKQALDELDASDLNVSDWLTKEAAR